MNRTSNFIDDLHSIATRICSRLARILTVRVYVGKSLSSVPERSVVLFPLQVNFFGCGLAGIVALKHSAQPAAKVRPAALNTLADIIDQAGHQSHKPGAAMVQEGYLGHPQSTDELWQAVQTLKRQPVFYEIFNHPKLLNDLKQLSQRLAAIVERESGWFSDQIGWLDAASVEVVHTQIEKIKDINWCLDTEISANVERIKDLMGPGAEPPAPETLRVYKNINAVLNSIDRLEVRGRDSAGISLMFIIDKEVFARFQDWLRQPQQAGLQQELDQRRAQAVLVNKNISINENQAQLVSLTLTYKVAAPNPTAIRWTMTPTRPAANAAARSTLVSTAISTITWPSSRPMKSADIVSITISPPTPRSSLCTSNRIF
jgi:glucosamine--fructose-6-phosphate aminotransferase (isomerizing)